MSRDNLSPLESKRHTNGAYLGAFAHPGLG